MAVSSRRYRPDKRGNNSTNTGFTDIIKMAAVVAVLVVVVIFGLRLFGGAPAADKFCEGVSVNGIALGGLTLEEGVNMVNALIDQRINKDTYTLVYGDKQWVFTPSEFDAHLDLTNELSLAWNFGHTGSRSEMRRQAAYVKENPQDYTRSVSYNEEKLDAFIQGIKSQIDSPSVSAQVTILDGGLEISQSRMGVEISAEELKDTLVNRLLSGSGGVIQLSPRQVEPEYTTDELVANTQLIAEWRTSLAESSGKRTKNVERALRPFNGLRVQPGELISFNELVGKRTKANGFFDAPEYDGTTVVQGVGGGTCQASTTLYGAVLLANLDVVVRGNHSMTVSYADPSLDAAVFETKDFRFTNNLNYPVYFYTSVTDKWATVKVYGPPCEHEVRLEYRIIDVFAPKGNRYEDDTTGKIVYYTDDTPVLKTEGKNGMRSQAYRVYYDRATGKEVAREEMDVDTYYASQPVYWRGTHKRSF